MSFVRRDNEFTRSANIQRRTITVQRPQRMTLSGVELTCAAVTGLSLLFAGCSDADASTPAAPSDGASDMEAPQAMDSAPFEVAVENSAASGNAVTGEAMPDDTPAASTPVGTSPRGASSELAARGAATPAGDDEAADPAANAEPAAPGATLQTSGRRLLDTCGDPLVVRGVEQVFGNQLPPGNDWDGLIEQIAASGVNAVRVLAGTDTLGIEDVDALLGIAHEHQLIAYVTPYGNEAVRWLEHEPVRKMLAKHAKYIIIDAFGEPTFDDRDRFVAESIAAIQNVRSWGYEVPLTVTANQFGRDLPSLFELGSEIVAADPLHNTILGWQAYWGSNNYYQEHYGMSLEQAVDAVAAAPFPIQLGLDRVTDFPSDQTADFGTLMSKTAEHGVGWLWWDWYNPYGNENNLTQNGDAGSLTSTGDTVLNTHPASVKNTARRACID
jgi:hypothetical protein